MTSYTVLIPDNLALGITASREAANAALPATIADPDHTGQGEAPQIPNPAICATDADYLSSVLLHVADSYAQQFKVGPYAASPEEAATLLPAGYVIAPPEIAPVALEAGVAALSEAFPALPAEQAAAMVNTLYSMLINGEGVIKPQ